MKGKNLFIILFIFIILYCFRKYDNRLKIFKISNFIDDDICDKLIKLDKEFVTSNILQNGKSKINGKARTSTTTSFKNGENIQIDIIKNKVASMLNVSLDKFEPIQLSKYSRGQEYKYHYDYFNTKETNITNQRHYTIIIYLNDVPSCDGGSTDFKYGNNFQPEKGSMIYWSNLNKQMLIDNRTLHSGKPILNDSIKYILTIWTRVDKLI